MPIKIERKLKREAKKKGLKPGSRRYGAYVYGTLNSKRLKRNYKKRFKKNK